MSSSSIDLLVAVVLVAVAIAALRFVRGPRDADRLIALDILFAAAIALCSAAALSSGQVLFLDVAIGVALIGFVATLAWARLISRRRAADSSADGEP